MADAIAAMTWAIGCTAKFVWPVPDRGLDRRLHRITAPTLVIWGKQDALVSSVYAEEFGSRIAGARASRCSRAAGTSRRWRSRRRRSRSSGGS